MTPLDEQLRQLAKENTEAFFRLMPESAIVQIKVCYLLKGGSTQAQAGKKVGKTKWQARNVKCPVC